MIPFPIKQPEDILLQQIGAVQPNRQSLGNSIDWNESDLDALANISSADLKAAEALWQQDAPPAFQDLLDAEVIEAGQ